MKKLLRTFILYVVALKTAEIIGLPLNFYLGFKTLIYTALALTGFDYLLKPIAKILFLPINLLTLGLLRWVINVIGLYLVTMLIKDFSISAYRFPGINQNGLVIPQIIFSTLVTYIIVSFSISLVVLLARWIFRK